MGYLGFGIFAEYLEVFDERTHGFDGLMVAHEAVECHIDIDSVFPLASYTRG